MRRQLITLTGILLAGAAYAQEAGKPATPEEIAAGTMKAMEALDAPAANAPAPGAGKMKTAKATKPVEDAADPNVDNEEDDSAAPSLLPAAPAEGARGMDLMTRTRMDMMVPVGRSHRGVHYPMYLPVETDRTIMDPLLGGIAGVTAPLASLFESELVTRIDDDHVQFDRAKWIQFDKTPTADGRGKPTMSLEIERGVYDLKNEILMTNQPVKIENQQFLITGDTMLHDRASGLTRVTGRVHVTFYNEEPAPPPLPAPSGAAPAPETPRQP